MSQNSRQRLLQHPHLNLSSSNKHLRHLLMLCQCRARNWHSKLLYSGLVWFSILGDYGRGGEGGYLTVQRVPRTVQYHNIPVSKYLMVLEPLYSIETIRGTHFSCSAFEFVCICLFPEGSLHPIVHIVLAWSTHLTALYCDSTKIMFVLVCKPSLSHYFTN